jgi:hypothetical protein
MDVINMAQDRYTWRAFVNTATNIRVSWNFKDLFRRDSLFAIIPCVKQIPKTHYAAESTKWTE